MTILTPEEKNFLDVFLHEATTSPFFNGPATKALHAIGVEYRDISYIAWAYEQDVPRTSYEWGHAADVAPPLPWTNRESVLRRNQEIQRIWEQKREVARGPSGANGTEPVSQDLATTCQNRDTTHVSLGERNGPAETPPQSWTAYDRFFSELDENLRKYHRRWVAYTAAGLFYVSEEHEDALAVQRYCQRKGLQPSEYFVGIVMPDLPIAEVTENWFAPVE